jgi:hypothetical protein
MQMKGASNLNSYNLPEADWQRFTTLMNQARINSEYEWNPEKLQLLIGSVFGAYMRLSINSNELHELFVFILQICRVLPENLETTSLRFYLAGVLYRLSFSIPQESRDLSWVELITGNETASIFLGIFPQQDLETHIQIPTEVKDILENLTAIVGISIENLGTLDVATLVQIVKKILTGYISHDFDFHTLELLQVLVLSISRNTKLSHLLLTQLRLLSNYIGGIVNISSAISRNVQLEELKNKPYNQKSE